VQSADAPHRLLDFLPAVYHGAPGLESFLEAFERTLFRVGVDTGPSVEEQIGRIPSFLDPYETPEDFLPWLAQWAAITLYREATDRRRLVAEMVPLYRIRGTREYVKRVLELYVDGTVAVDEEDLPGMVVGKPGYARVGQDTRLGEETFRFSVSIAFSTIPPDRQQRFRLVDLVRRVIDLARPAYTHYRLTHNLFEEERGFIIAVRSTVGVDTLLESRGASSSRERHEQ
jgi:phage tail-like protein